MAAESHEPVSQASPSPSLPPGLTVDRRTSGADAYWRPFEGLIADGFHVLPFAVTIAHADRRNSPSLQTAAKGQRSARLGSGLSKQPLLQAHPRWEIALAAAIVHCS